NQRLPLAIVATLPPERVIANAALTAIRTLADGRVGLTFEGFPFYNGTTTTCVPFYNQVPGSSHNVSVYIAGSGSVGISMGIISSSGITTEGVGSATLPGC
ncbi:MAG: hypothetical protein WCE44_16715, partial [Candidatus Velthaea sp.]